MVRLPAPNLAPGRGGSLNHRAQLFFGGATLRRRCREGAGGRETAHPLHAGAAPSGGKRRPRGRPLEATRSSWRGTAASRSVPETPRG